MKLVKINSKLRKLLADYSRWYEGKNTAGELPDWPEQRKWLSARLIEDNLLGTHMAKDFWRIFNTSCDVMDRNLDYCNTLDYNLGQGRIFCDVIRWFNGGVK